MRVLIIDDDKVFRNILTKALKKEEYEIFTAEDGESALLKISKIKPNIVLVDESLPAMGGLDFTRRLRERNYFDEVPVIILSQADNKKMQKEARFLGIEDFIIKSQSSAEEIAARVKSVISKKYF